MASFTDEISKFNPYVQQLPVDAMTQVGMYKQQQYDQGVQKIQSYIDNVAGMDVYKQEHKQYLQSKLNELGGRLKTVAAGDFSNSQLVNSVGGMATQIVKDPIVQNAVYSTQVVRKGDADREVAAKAGKTSPNNDQDWEDQKAEWLNDGKLDSRFNGKYVEHWDVDKKLTEKAELIMKFPDANSQENMWQTDAAGNTLYYRQEPVTQNGKVVKDKSGKVVTRTVSSIDPSQGGKPEVADVMKKISIKGTSPEKLYNNFLDSLDSRDAQQLRIDAKAKYRGATMESFAPDIIKTYNNRKKLQSQEIVSLAVELQTNPNLSLERKQQYTARITELQNAQKSGALDKELNATLEALKDPKNLEKYKTDIYTQQLLISKATDMSYKSYEQEIKTNPAFQAYMERQKFNLETQKFSDESRRGWANYNLAKDKEAWDRYTWSEDFKFKTEKEKKEWLEKHPNPVTRSGVLPTEVPLDITQAKDLLNKTLETSTMLENDYADRLFPGMTKEERRVAFDNLEKNQAINPSENLSPDTRAFLNKYRAISKELHDQTNVITGAKKKVNEQFEELAKNTSVPGVAEFSGKDILKVATVIKKVDFNKFGGDVTRGGGYGFNYKDAEKYFVENGMMNLIPILKAYNKSSWESLTPEETKLKAALGIAGIEANSIAPTLNKTETEYLGAHTPRKTALYQSLNYATDKDVITRFITGKLSEELRVGSKSDNNASELQAMLTGEKGANTSFELEKKSDGTINLIGISPDGKKKVSMVVTDEEAQGYFPQVNVSSPFDPIRTTIQASPNYTTNLANRRSPEIDYNNGVNAAISGYDIPGLKNDPIAPMVRFDIEGDYDNNGKIRDGYVINMYMKDPKAKDIVNPDGSVSTPSWMGIRLTNSYVPEGGIMNIWNGITKDAVYEAIEKFKKQPGYTPSYIQK